MGSQQSPPNPSAFADLGSAIRDCLSKRGFDTPTEAQQRAIPNISNRENVLVVAPTGTGKTETALLPVFDALLETPPDGIGALLVTPLRALNRDMRERLEWWGDQLNLDIQVRHGDTTQYQRQKQSNNPPDLLIITPETLQAMLTGSRLREGLSSVEHVVVDEVHELAGSKRGVQLAVALERLRELSGDFQRIGLSATVGDADEVGRFLTGDRNCTLVEINIGTRLNIDVVQPDVTESDTQLARDLMVDAEIASHLRTIDQIVTENESTLVFVNTRQTAEALGSRFTTMETNIGVHHGSLAKPARIQVEEDFKSGELDALLCTSSMELGIDVGRINHVVQYASPRQVSRLLQRVGRAGHTRNEVSRGTIVSPSIDDTLESLAIVRRALEGDVEPANIHHGSLDTVANQVAGLTMGYGELSAMKAYEIITRAYPFRELAKSTFKEIIEELSTTRVVWLDREEDIISKRNGSWQYFYSNLSMIPDEATFDVHDIAGGSQIGTLDERFVVNFGEPGEIFIERGQMWRITEIDEEEQTVEVTPVENPTGEVPSWTGQEIPVPFEIAQDVGRIRERAAAALSSSDNRESFVVDLAAEFPTTRMTLTKAVDQFAEQELMPTADLITIEGTGRHLVINACFGHKLNETFGRLLAALLGQRSGSSIGLDIDPYRITLEVPQGVTQTDVVAILTDTDPRHIKDLLELSLKNSDILKFRLTQVATKFGRLDDPNISSEKMSSSKLIKSLMDTPAYDEAVREIFHEDFAVETAVDVLENIQAGVIELETISGSTPVGSGGRSDSKEFLTPENADADVLQTVQERILDEDVVLFCVHCKSWRQRTKVRRVRDTQRCPKCDSTMLASLNPNRADDVITSVKADSKDEEMQRQTRRAFQSASLVQNHGRKAVIALAARGVGPQNAARIINNLREDEMEFYRDILRREKEYARTKSFWD